MQLHPEFFQVPEQAITAYEAWAKVRVTVHDLEGTLWPYLPAVRFNHDSAACFAVKGRRYNNECIRSDMTHLRKSLANSPEGQVKVCHAGLVECVVPVFMEGDLRWILFAGVRRPGKKLSCAQCDTRQTRGRDVWQGSRIAPAPLDDPEAFQILEGLRQLAARLRCWLSDIGQRPAVTGDPTTTPLARWRLIQQFMAHYSSGPARLADLADVMGVSETRAGHIVRELCGKTFLQLLTEARVRTASVLLRNSELSIGDVAARTGWGDLSRFYRLFRREMGMTPRQYRCTFLGTRPAAN